MVTITPNERFTPYNPVTPTTAFQVNFPIFDNDDVKLFLEGIEVTAVTITGSYIEGVSTNAVINVAGGGITGNVVVVGDRDPRRTDQYQNGRLLQIPDHNYSLNRLTIENQELKRDLKRAVKLPFGETFGFIAPPMDGHTLVWRKLGLAWSIQNGRNEEDEAGAWRAAIVNEAAICEAADVKNAGDISQETQDRIAADSAIHIQIDGIIPTVTNLTAQAAASAASAASSEVAAAHLVQVATSGFTGWPVNAILDLGWVTETVTYFDQDWGRVTQLAS